MDELRLLNDLLPALLMSASTAIWPPIAVGAFWSMVGFFAVVSIFFDDETPRGNPGIDYTLLPADPGLARPDARRSH